MIHNLQFLSDRRGWQWVSLSLYAIYILCYLRRQGFAKNRKNTKINSRIIGHKGQDRKVDNFISRRRIQIMEERKMDKRFSE